MTMTKLKQFPQQFPNDYSIKTCAKNKTFIIQQIVDKSATFVKQTTFMHAFTS